MTNEPKTPALTAPVLAELRRLKAAWLNTDGTSKKVAKAFNEALRPYGENEEQGLFFLPE